jgi:hypothetical protein
LLNRDRRPARRAITHDKARRAASPGAAWHTTC